MTREVTTLCVLPLATVAYIAPELLAQAKVLELIESALAAGAATTLIALAGRIAGKLLAESTSNGTTLKVETYSGCCFGLDARGAGPRSPKGGCGEKRPTKACRRRPGRCRVMAAQRER
jgi:hypothetical protein